MKVGTTLWLFSKKNLILVGTLALGSIGVFAVFNGVPHGENWVNLESFRLSK
jgi:hypothetical protein